jgi:hypothetical protein
LGNNFSGITLKAGSLQKRARIIHFLIRARLRLFAAVINSHKLKRFSEIKFLATKLKFSSIRGNQKSSRRIFQANGFVVKFWRVNSLPDRKTVLSREFLFS